MPHLAAGCVTICAARSAWDRSVPCTKSQLSNTLTPSAPDVPSCCCSKGSVPYWSNPPFLIFDIRALWRSGLSARAPECQKLKMVGQTSLAKCKALSESAVKGLTVATFFKILNCMKFQTSIKPIKNCWQTCYINGFALQGYNFILIIIRRMRLGIFRFFCPPPVEWDSQEDFF